MDDIPTVVGIDASWTGLAMVSITGDVVVTRRLTSAPQAGVSLYQRLDKLGREFTSNLALMHPTMVLMEGYSFGSTIGREKAGELGGHLKWLMWALGVHPLIVPPMTLKCFVVGKGGAKKEAMMMYALKRWDFEAPDNDTCDAYCLARFGLELLKSTQASQALRAKCEDLALGHPVAPKKPGKPKKLAG